MVQVTGWPKVAKCTKVKTQREGSEEKLGKGRRRKKVKETTEIKSLNQEMQRM